jgi:hypothetical protein
MLSELVRQHPQVDGRFETGFLMGKRPGDFESTGAFPRFVRRFWGVADKDMRKLTTCRSFPQMYETLRDVSNLPDKTVQIYDKTPAYMGNLRRRKGECVPHQVAEHLNRYTQAYELAKRIYGSRILLVRNEHLCTEPLKYGREIYEFLGLEWKDEYIELRDVYRLHDNVYGNQDKSGTSVGIVADRLTEWQDHLTEQEVAKLRKFTVDSSRWYWEK